jgi:putative peptide zinc metalloprotease protein
MAELNETPLFSQHWHRVKDLRPRWTLGVQVLRQYQREQLSYTVSNSAHSQSLRLNRSAWEIFARFQGVQTVDQIWLQLQGQFAAQAPTQDDMLELIHVGFEANLLQSSDLLSFDLLSRQAQQKERSRLKGRFSPMGIRFDLGNPNRWFNFFSSPSKLIFGPIGLFCWLIAILFLLAGALTHERSLGSELARSAAQPGYWLMMWLSFIPIKALHEVSHALAAKSYDVEVRQIGIHWMWFSPAPFVDVSGAEQLPKRMSRAIISAAGIAAELLIAAIALLVWQGTEPGLLHAFSLACLSTAGISTLLFNGNPLVKMDGYYVLTDALALPNLASRSQQWWAARWHRLLGGLNQDRLVLAKRERAWLIAYTPASWLWRLVLFYTAWVWLGGIHRWLGILIGIAALVTLVVMPAVKLVRQTHSSQSHFLNSLSQKPKLLAAALIIFALFALLPVPDRLLQPGVVWLAGEQAIKAQADGFTSSRMPLDGAKITQPLALDDPKLNLELDRVKARIKGIKVKMQQAFGTDLTQAAVFEKELEIAQAQQARVEQKLSKLTAQSGLAGEPLWNQPADLAGRWVRTGDILGYVKSKDPNLPVLIQVALAQPQAARIAEKSPRIALHVVSHTGSNSLIPATITGSGPAALTELPSAALSTVYGGLIETDPTDPKAVKPLGPTYNLQLSIARGNYANLPWLHGAQTVTVIDFGYSPLAWQWLRLVQEHIRSRFAVQLV